jgi:hypothetical protein
VCTVLLRLAPDTPVPLVVAAVRDEFADRPWDPPAAHWPDAPGLVGGRDRVGGGTWLAVSPGTQSVAALLNDGARTVAPKTPPAAIAPRVDTATTVLREVFMVDSFGRCDVPNRSGLPHDRRTA